MTIPRMNPLSLEIVDFFCKTEDGQAFPATNAEDSSMEEMSSKRTCPKCNADILETKEANICARACGWNEVRAEPWDEGKVVVGYYQKAEELTGCKSRKITFSLASAGGGSPETAFWEAAALSRFVFQMKKGEFYLIHCMGKKKYKNGRGWAFKVYRISQPEEQAIALKKYGVLEAYLGTEKMPILS